ncbi:MAG: phosphoribosylamine--glycine ligase [Bauldia sp.]|nr:phosphoribosylamine--glycine ligase [Bauldia sp.]
MNVLLIGSGGREHALAWKLRQSPTLARLFATPGNAGIAEHAQIVALDVGDHQAVIEFCKTHFVGLVVVGPEGPLIAGLVDDLEAAGIPAFGPTKAAARLEGSKGFTKDLCSVRNIPTAAYRRFADAAEARDYVRSAATPIVVKADGLAAGKGVTIAATTAEALAAVDDCFGGAFGIAGSEVVIEEFLTGEEVSFFALCDGVNAIPLATAQDHKRVLDGDRGANTGGMGAYSPAAIMTDALCERTMARIIKPTLAAMAARGAPFKGVLYAGIILTAEGPKLIEYNVRFGDPECQVLMARLESDLLDLLLATREGRLDKVSLSWLPEPAITVVMTAQGYPGAYKRGGVITGLKEAAKLPGVTVFHAGTTLVDGAVTATGGRVLDVTATGPTLIEARNRAYAAVEKIDWPEVYYRKDIGWRALARA